MIGRLDRYFGLVFTAFEIAGLEGHRPCSVFGDSCGGHLVSNRDRYIRAGFASALQGDTFGKSVRIEVVRNAFGPFGHRHYRCRGVDYKARAVQRRCFTVRRYGDNRLVVAVRRKILTVKDGFESTVITNGGRDLLVAYRDDDLCARFAPTGDRHTFRGPIAPDCGGRVRFVHEWSRL